MNAADELRDRIRARGPVTFAEFMEVALYGPNGFYAEPPVGESGHFVTSPHVHPVFADLLAKAIGWAWSAMGGTGPPAVVEAGAGDGTLAAQLLRRIPGVDYAAVERSELARRSLKALGVRAYADIGDLPQAATAVLVANELLDNLPFRRVRARDDGLRELLVGLRGDGFVEIEARCPADIAHAAPPMEPGEEAAVSPAASDFIRQIARMLGRGYAILIDYARASAEPAGGIHGYRDQRVVLDVLTDPGSADITAGVDLTAIAREAHASGLHVFGPVRQTTALLGLGFQEWDLAERARQGRLLDDGSGSEAVRAWSDRNAARLLVDPSGLGRLHWLVVATAGLPQPPWLATHLP